jgi:hypothetical protein
VLVLEQAAHQIGPRVVLVLAAAAREEHLRLDTHQDRGHLEELAGALELEPLGAADRDEELLGDLGDRDVEDVDVLLADQVQQQVERAVEALQVDGLRVLGAAMRGWRRGLGDGSRRGAHTSRLPNDIIRP